MIKANELIAILATTMGWLAFTTIVMLFVSINADLNPVAVHIMSGLSTIIAAIVGLCIARAGIL